MEKTIALEAPCKINLHLRVLEKRDDGFHGIESIFQAVSLCDRIVLGRTGSDGEQYIECPAFDLPLDNTVSRAINLFREKSGISGGVHVTLDKQIPAGAGLGGGSSDAAAVLKGLNRLFDAGLDAGGLYDLACRIGSDVPFFLGSPTALVTGRGEILESLEAREEIYGVLIWPGIHCGTAAAYAAVDTWANEHPDLLPEVPGVNDLRAIHSGSLTGWKKFVNSFSAPIMEQFPVIRRARDEIYDAGAFFAEMSGSGSSVFGLFGEKKEAEQAFSRLSIHWEFCRKFLLLAHSPMR